MPNHKIHLFISLHDFSVSPEEITELVGLAPTRSSASRVHGRIPFWRLSSPVPASDSDIDDHWAALAPAILPKERAFAQLSAACKIVIGCAVYIHERAPAVHFPHELISFASRINAEIDVDIYLAGDSVARRAAGEPFGRQPT